MSGLGVTCNVCGQVWKGPLDTLPGCRAADEPAHCPLALKRLESRDIEPHQILVRADLVSISWQCRVCLEPVMGLSPPACMSHLKPNDCPRLAVPEMVTLPPR